MFSARTKIWLILALVLLTVLMSIFGGCAIDIRSKATALGGRIDETAQISLTSGRPARD